MLRWSPYFDTSKESHITQVWVIFLSTSCVLYKSTLHSLKSLFGKKIQLDSITAKLSRPSMAHVFVEIENFYL